MEIGTWILVAILSVTLFIFLLVGIILALRLIDLAKEAQKVINTSQQIANKADDVVDNIKGMTSVGGIVKTFANRVIENQERRYAAEDAAREAMEAEERMATSGAARGTTGAEKKATASARTKK